ncbi:Response regulator receiver domain-containing protein [Saccharicrinis carchari]|uniref:Response regulator receiver domain-containing protein n=1 Tax=Saccharicrinis carchari TaxID=1168039 RepID=A0A521AS01_SACCC|nr:response regulator [Saccharicrinis carchari]SMO37597.1 Response regulator receiver domain-containing protein [Saccharicrinis carchari]
MEKKGRILVVDDNPKNIQLLGNILNDNHYDLEVALGGKEALQWLRHDKFDLILLDIMMPEINGFEVCEIIRQDPENNIMPIIYLSAKNDKESTVQGFNVGGQDFISKPFDTSELLARVSTHIELKKSKERLLNTNRDLEQKVRERTLELEESNKRLQALTQTKDKFLSFIGREIASPLNDINRVVNLIKHSAESSRMSETINLLEHSTVNLAFIVKMASQITQINNNENIEFQEFYLNGLIEHILLQEDGLIDSKNLNPVCEIDDSIKLKANKDLIKNSFLGILDTIFKHIEHDSRIHIYLNILQHKKELVMTFNPPNWDCKDTNTMPEETLLYFSYADLVMDFHQGTFEIKQDTKASMSFVWTFNS